ncbi:MAG: YraN family protein [Candidatus Brocadiia bacterium]
MIELLRGIGRRFRRLLGRDGADAPHLRVGRLGEDAAVRCLKRKGYTILERNFTVRQGEVDVVAFRDGTVAFVEVRTQTAPARIDPAETITRRKQRRVIKAARQYSTLHDLERENVLLRFDAVLVLLDDGGRPQSVEHIEDAFQAPTAAGF